MLNIRNILFARDYTSNSDEALPFALMLARQTGAKLHSVFAEVVYGARFEHAVEQARVEAELAAHLPDAAAFAVAEAESIDVQHAVVRGVSAAPALIDYAYDHSIDLIVTGTHGRRGVKRVLLGSVAEEMVRLAPCPVLTIRSPGAPTPKEVRTILVPLDFSTHSRNALLHAQALAEQFSAKLLLLHVVEDKFHPAFYGIALQSIYDADPLIEEKALAHLKQEFARTGGQGQQVEYAVRYGVPASVILDVAEERKVDMLVMGTHGLTGLERFFLGSVSEKVVRNAACPVFTIKSFGKKLVSSYASDVADRQG